MMPHHGIVSGTSCVVRHEGGCEPVQNGRLRRANTQVQADSIKNMAHKKNQQKVT